jgi:hypothetical protein
VGVKSLTDSLLTFSLPTFPFSFSLSLPADFDLLVIKVILSWFGTDGILRLLFETVYVNHILGGMGIAVIRVNFWPLGLSREA